MESDYSDPFYYVDPHDPDLIDDPNLNLTSDHPQLHHSNISTFSHHSNRSLSSTTSDFASWRPYFYICYIIFGGLALSANITILYTIIRRPKKLLAKWPTVASLAASNLTSALHSFCYGIYRLPLLSSGLIDQPLSAWTCMASLMPTFHVLAYAVPPVIQCVIGTERIVAICAFNWYRVHWSPRKTWYVIGVVITITVAASATPLWIKVFSQPFMVTRECSSPRIIGLEYLFTVIRFAIIVGVCSAFCSIVSALIGYFRMKRMNRSLSSSDQASQQSESHRLMYSQFKRQFRVSLSMLTVAIFDLL